MCTVSYIPKASSKSFVLTSNRDEKHFRATVKPQIYSINNMKLVFPKDEKAGGSWIAMNNIGRICCLLNGAFIAHQKQPYYTVSRGTILKEVCSFNGSVNNYFEMQDLSKTEPFTIVTIEQKNGDVNELWEFIWDGENKHYKSLDINKPYIWSSVTLYSDDHRKLRREWFKEFLKDYIYHPDYNKILNFHGGNHTQDKDINVVMERDNGIKTVSITQITYKHGLCMRYADLLKETVTEVSV